MSYELTSFVNCETLQSELTNHFGCDRTRILKPNETSLVQFLFSPANTANTLQSQMDSDGKLKDVKLRYMPRIPTGAVDTTITPKDCVSEIDRGQRSETYTLDENVGVQIESVIDTENLIRFCQSNPDYLNEVIAKMMDAAIRRMDYELALQVVALSGAFGQGESDVAAQTKTVRTRKTASGATQNDVSTDFVEEIDFAAENAGYCGAPAVFGFHEIYKAYKAIAASNCCSDAGINIAQLQAMTGSLFMPNRNIATVFNDSNKFITLDPGAVQPIYYNRYMINDKVMTVNTETTKRTVIVDPRYGIPFDFKADYSCGVWSLFISLAFKAVGVPDDIYESEDIYSGVTGVNKFIVNNS